MSLSAPSWDLFITLFLIITIGYGFLMQRERIVVTMIAAYVGLVITALFAPEVLGFFHGDNPLLGRYFIRANLTDSQVESGLFLLTMILVSAKAGINAERGKGWLSPFELIVLSGLTGALILATIIDYLPDANAIALAEQSRLVGYLVQYHDLWVLAPIAALVGLGIRDGRRRD